MIELLLEWARTSGDEADLRRRLAAHVAAVRAGAGHGDRTIVGRIERAVQDDLQGSFTFTDDGSAVLSAGTWSFPAGRFETPSLATLKQRALARCGRAAAANRPDGQPDRAPTRLWVLLGASPATDIGSLQATAGPGTVFQVASQFNCLEAPGPYVSPIANYFGDSTQGPRAAISAFPGTFLRHYSAPAPDGTRFVQRTDGPQLNLLEAICTPGVARVRNGYLTARDIADPRAFAVALTDRFQELRVGVHSGVPVVLGYDWDGAVDGDPYIDQVFTSTLAGGYSGGVSLAPGGGRATGADYEAICRSLLRAAYLGTLLAAVSLGRSKVVLTLIGGGVFENPRSSSGIRFFGRPQRSTGWAAGRSTSL